MNRCSWETGNRKERDNDRIEITNSKAPLYCSATSLSLWLLLLLNNVYEFGVWLLQRVWRWPPFIELPGR